MTEKEMIYYKGIIVGSCAATLIILTLVWFIL